MNREDFMKMKKIAAIIVGSILFLSVAVFTVVCNTMRFVPGTKR